MPFQLKPIKDEAITAIVIREMSDRGFAKSRDDEDSLNFVRPLYGSADINVEVVIGPRSDESTTVHLFFTSQFVQWAFDEMGLHPKRKPLFDHPRFGHTILVVDLRWLSPEPLLTNDWQAKDYHLSSRDSVDELMNDLDEVAAELFLRLSEPGQMMTYLRQISLVGTTRMSGRPVTVRPHIYAALLAVRDASYDVAEEILNDAKPPHWMDEERRKAWTEDFFFRAEPIRRYISEKSH
jgi:hypothetical protein